MAALDPAAWSPTSTLNCTQRLTDQSGLHSTLAGFGWRAVRAGARTMVAIFRRALPGRTPVTLVKVALTEVNVELTFAIRPSGAFADILGLKDQLRVACGRLGGDVPRELDSRAL
jgi:hypothetical protein